MRESLALGTTTAMASAAALGLLLIAGGCGKKEDEEKPKPADGALGEECTLEDAGSCAEGLVCSERTEGKPTCTVPLGGACDPDAEVENGGCPESAECVVREDAQASELPPGAVAGAGGESPGEDSEGDEVCLIRKGGECDPAEELCSSGLLCAEVTDGTHRCFAPFVLAGTVRDSGTGDPIDGALVIAIDEEGVAVSDVAESDSDGSYRLSVPVVREENGAPAEAAFTLRSSAQDFQPFPYGVRVALPIMATDAVENDEQYVVESALTEIALIALPDGERSWASGEIVNPDDVDAKLGGVLLVATGPDGAFSAVSDQSGHFTIFNLPQGSYDVKGYASDLQLEPASLSISSSPVEDVSLAVVSNEGTTVTGNIQIVNAAGGSQTSVILVVEDTFEPNAARGEVPRGLRAPRTGAPNVDGDFSISGVPDGRYVVLAAYENDELVRDPDQNISGTDFVAIEVSAGASSTYAISESFKVTEALAIFGPGAEEPEAVTSAPTLRWADDSSEDWYDVRVFDSFGNEVWSKEELPGVSGGDVSLEYAGPLEPGMYYQFRVTSWRQPGGKDASAISATEDLRGVFYKPAP